MAKKEYFWFKFQYLKWLTDEQLNRCSLETQGFWVRCICMMYKGETAKLQGTMSELSRLLSVTPAEFKRAFAELNRTKTATVTQTSEIFTLVSRRYQRELKVKEQNRLRKRKERSHATVTDQSQDRVKSKSKSKSKKKSSSYLESREESRVTAAPTPPEPELKKTESAPKPEPDLKKVENPTSPANGLSNNPAVVLYAETFGPPGAAFAQNVAARVQHLGVWRDLIAEKSAYADDPQRRQNVPKWILGEYQKRIADSPPPIPVGANGPPPGKVKTAREYAEDAKRQMIETVPKATTNGTSKP